KYPEGFDPETNEWREGFEEQRDKWEQEYAAAQARWEAHKAQIQKQLADEATAAAENTFSSDSTSGGVLADDEALAALRERLASR
ncbi:MAG: 30S ribosomal protein S1, partial [Acidobacteria bacterium]|nr:30S ribosomal protein S1 [Acidobacteriota bacterium]